MSLKPLIAGLSQFGGGGNMVGPGSATDNAIVRFDATTGKLVQNSAIVISDVSGNSVSLLSTTGNALVLGTTSFGASVTFASATGIPTFGTAVNVLTLAVNQAAGADADHIFSVVGKYGAGGREFYVTNTGTVFALGGITTSEVTTSSGGLNLKNETTLVSDAANTLAQRSGANAQAFRVYGNLTGAHYLNLQHNGTNAIVNVNGGGALLISSLPVANPGPGILWNNAGTPAIGT